MPDLAVLSAKAQSLKITLNAVQSQRMLLRKEVPRIYPSKRCSLAGR